MVTRLIAIVAIFTSILACQTRSKGQKRQEVNLFLVTIKPADITGAWNDGESTKIIKVIEYLESPCACGSRMCAANTLGTQGTDTLIIYSICSGKQTFMPGDVVKVTKQSLPTTEFTVFSGQQEINHKYKSFVAELKGE